MRDAISIETYDKSWPIEFHRIGGRLRQSLGERALRIDHIGSTAIIGMAAKSVIDIQISVASFSPMDELVTLMGEAGFCWRADNPERTKRYFREKAGQRRTHVHMRLHGSWHEQWALLFRDYMRALPDEHAAYADLKRRLADQFGGDRQGYTDAKDDHFWFVIRRADRWAAEGGWLPAQSDA